MLSQIIKLSPVAIPSRSQACVRRAVGRSFQFQRFSGYPLAGVAAAFSTMSAMDGKPIELFYSYSHRDEGMRQRLETHLSVLKRAGAIAGWHDRRIGAGAEWKRQISDHLESADVILLLISSDFLASDYCWDIEMKRAIERHDRGDALVIPIMLHPVDWEGAPFAKLEVLPRDGRPVSKWPKQDEAFTDVAKGIRAAVRRRLEANASSSGLANAPSSALASASTSTLANASTSPFSVELWTADQRTAAANQTEAGSQADYPIGARIVVRFRANRDCYLTLLNIGTSGKLTVLFPNALHSDDRILKGRIYEIPSREDEFEYAITGPPGVEILKAIPRQSYAVLREVVLSGEIERGRIRAIVNLQQRAARNVTSALLAQRLIVSNSPRAPLRLGFPVEAVERWFSLAVSSHRALNHPEVGRLRSTASAPDQSAKGASPQARNRVRYGTATAAI